MDIRFRLQSVYLLTLNPSPDDAGEGSLVAEMACCHFGGD